MRKANLLAGIISLLVFFACQKTGSNSQITLTPSATQVGVGEQLSATVSANANAVSWSVSPSSSAVKTFGITTSKINYFTFNQPGVYTIAVSTKNLSYDSTRQSLDSCWNAGSHTACTKGIDSTSVNITVTK